jgi:hypothetical protein
MNISFELIIPPVILGFLTIMILNSNAAVMTSSVENRLTFELQERSKLALTIVENESRSLTDIVSVTNTDFIYVTAQNDTVHIYRDDRKMIVAKTLSGGTATTDEYALKLSDLRFEWDLSAISFVTIRAISESIPEEEVGQNPKAYRGIAERAIYFQNLSL